MRGVMISFPLAVRTIFKDPINVMLFMIPTLIAIGIYILVGTFIVYNASTLTDYVKLYMPHQMNSGFLTYVITAFLMFFFLMLMNWTYVILVGILASPFNDTLSARIEKKLAFQPLPNKEQTWKELFARIGNTFTNEFKKILFIVVLGALAFVMNYIPVLYPVALVLSSLLLAIQFIDYSWSRHNMNMRQCLIDLLKNFFPYTFMGFIFLLFVSVPIINAFVPAFATSYFTVLWLYRQNKINPSIQTLLES